ncbi:hypothetical protein MP228_000074 [Amoeboaphelidium protococcarum]|nr:hypothetical protein MP228_000074 [Amoeboaphelidium protococcarum]
MENNLRTYTSRKVGGGFLINHCNQISKWLAFAAGAGAGVTDVLNGTQQALTVPRTLDIMQLVRMELVGYAQWNWYRQAVTQLNMLIENSCAPLVARQITQLMQPNERMEHLKIYYFDNSVARKKFFLAEKYDQWNLRIKLA